MSKPVKFAKCHPDKRVEAHGLCVSCYQKSIRAKNPDLFRIKDRLKKEKNPDKYRQRDRRSHLKSKYGLTTAQFEQMVLEQKGLCFICDQPGNLCIDHCHATGTVRGLLCRSCNVGIGHFNDDPVILEKAIAYLKK